MLNRHVSKRGDLSTLMTWLMWQTVLKHVLLMKAKRSTLKMKYFVKERKDPLLIMTWVMNPWWWTRRTWTSEFQDYHIPLRSTRRVPPFENWFRKLRTIQIDMLFNKIYDRINHLILSAQNQNKWFRMWVTLNYMNCSRRNPKRSAQCVYHTGISVNSTARAGISCIKKEEPIRNSSITRWTFFQSLSMSSRREDLMDIVMVNSRETKNIILLTNWRRNAKREISKEFMTDSYEIQNSVFEWMKIIETKIFVDDGMLLRMKITLTIWQHKNTSTFRANGGFIQLSKVLIICHCGIDLISSRHCLPCNDCNKKQEKNHKCLITLTSTNNGRHKVHLLHSGIGKVHGRLLIIPKVKKEMHQVLSERGDLLLAVFGNILRKRFLWIQSILLQIDRLQLTAVYCNRREV